MVYELKSFTFFSPPLKVYYNCLYMAITLTIAVFPFNAEADCMEWREVSLIFCQCSKY